VTGQLPDSLGHPLLVTPTRIQSKGRRGFATKQVLIVEFGAHCDKYVSLPVPPLIARWRQGLFYSQAVMFGPTKFFKLLLVRCSICPFTHPCLFCFVCTHLHVPTPHCDPQRTHVPQRCAPKMHGTATVAKPMVHFQQEEPAGAGTQYQAPPERQARAAGSSSSPSCWKCF
jgi:hypothetical protein